MIRLMGKLVVYTLLFHSTLSAQCIKGNCYNGYGTYEFSNGSRYIGNFVDGRAHGKGIIYFNNGNKYIGHWEDDVRQGEGRFVFNEGHEYRGGFRQNKFYGKGVMNYANGDQYVGQFRNNQPNGLGKYTFHDGDRYEGNFNGGRFEGEGTMYYKDGSKFRGFWSNNKKHGTGTLYAANGKVFSGEWVSGEMLEEEIYLFEDSQNTNSGSTIPALRNCNQEYCESGLGTFTYSDGSRYVGDFKNGEPEGNCTVHYANGNRYEGYWKNGVPHGEGVLYYSNGSTINARWRNGKAIEPNDKTDHIYEENVVDVERNNAVKIWAVIVGIGRYQHMPYLRFTDDDAYQIYAHLKSPIGGALEDNQIKVLIDEDATRDNILRTMRSTLHKADENDVVLFYFSGHGLEGSFIPCDFDGWNNRLHHEEIKKIMEDSRAKHKLVLGDACHSGSLSSINGGQYLASKSPVHTTLKKYYEAFENTNGGLAFMMSSRGEEVSLEDGGLRSGIFSHFLIQGLNGAADKDRNKIITIDELYNYVYGNVRSYTARAQSPTLTGKFDRAMPVGVVRH
jgi:hypothetical protein